RTSVRLAPQSRWAAWSGFVFLTSGFLISAVFLMGQFDVIHLFFSMLGLYYLLQGRRRAFVAAFAVAMAIKWFPLFIFLPVLLLVEKRVSRILLCLAGVLSVAFVFKVPFLFSENPSAKTGSDLIAFMVLDNRLPLGSGGVPIFPLLFVLVCVASYVRRPGSTAELHRTAVYAGFAGLAAFFVSAPAFPYWFAMLCPFLAILWAINPALARVNLLLETGLTAVMIVLHQIIFFWTYDLSIVSPMLLPRIFEPVGSLADPVSPLGLYTRLGLVSDSSVLAAIFTAGIVCLLVLHRPRTDEDLALLTPDDDQVVALVHVRTALMLGLMLVPAAAYLYSLIAHGTAA
uniref:hypothetical protein n=1 Tax=Nocardioides sp. TaxID=35761 RepID=UPI00286DFF18